MNKLLSACYAEYIKARKSKVFPVTIIAFSLAPIMGSLFVIVLRSRELLANNKILEEKAQQAAFSPDWPGFFGLLAQAVGVGGIIVFGFVASWVFGREYSDRTAKDLFVLPISRATIVISKLLTIVAWCLLLTVTIILLGLILGFALKLPGWSFNIFAESLKNIFITSIMVILLCSPVSFFASIGRGYLAPLGFVVITLVLAQIIGALGYGAYPLGHSRNIQ